MSLSGRLEDVGLADIFQILSIGKKSGSLVIRGDNNINALIIFRKGLVVRAETNALTEDVGDDLLKAGLIDEGKLQLARMVRRELIDKSIADILIELEAVDKHSVDKIAKKRLEKIISILLPLEDGDFVFEPNIELPTIKELPDPGCELSRGISADYLIMEGARVYDEQQHYGHILEEEFPLGDDFMSETVMSDTPRDISALQSLTQELRLPESLSEISLLVLRFASDIFQRGVLFSLDGTQLVGLGQFGLEIEQPDERIREMALDISNSVFFKKIIKELKPYKGKLQRDNVVDSFLNEIGNILPDEVAVYPIVADGKVVALLYCDNSIKDEPIGETPGLDIFLTQAGLALEKAALKKKLLERNNK